jgi:hypothetical protein
MLSGKALVGPRDMLISKRFEQKWTKLTYSYDEWDKLTYSVKLIPCEVDHPDKFGYINSQWYRLEEPDLQVTLRSVA